VVETAGKRVRLRSPAVFTAVQGGGVFSTGKLSISGEGCPVTLVSPSAPTESASPILIELPPYRSRGVVFSSVPPSPP
jgi:hypothetical protein